MKEVWPAIASRVPGAIIEVIGKWSRPAQESVPHFEEIRFAGFVPELGKALRKKIMIVPVWIGAVFAPRSWPRGALLPGGRDRGWSRGLAREVR